MSVLIRVSTLHCVLSEWYTTDNSHLSNCIATCKSFLLNSTTLVLDMNLLTGTLCKRPLCVSILSFFPCDQVQAVGWHLLRDLRRVGYLCCQSHSWKGRKRLHHWGRCFLVSVKYFTALEILQEFSWLIIYLFNYSAALNTLRQFAFLYFEI